MTGLRPNYILKVITVYYTKEILKYCIYAVLNNEVESIYKRYRNPLFDDEIDYDYIEIEIFGSDFSEHIVVSSTISNNTTIEFYKLNYDANLVKKNFVPYLTLMTNSLPTFSNLF
ncbi:MAG: hypothetical protein ACKVOM_09200 [Ferruginibacter sp.]